MIFDRLYVNGNVDPVGTGKEIALSWSYACDGKRNETQTAFRVTVRGGGETFDTGVITGSENRFTLPEKWTLKEATRYTWTVRGFRGEKEIISPARSFETALWDYSGAKWLTCGEDVSSPVFVKKFTLREKPVFARAYITGVGLFTCRVNGEDASDRLLMPSNTIYDVRRYVETLPLDLKPDENTLEVQLGGGYNMDFSKYGFRYECEKGFLAAVVIRYENGDEERIYSDESFLWRESEITENSIYHGETFDARRKNLPLRPAVINGDAAPKGALVPDELPPIRVIAARDPVASWETEEGTTFDFGVNAAGIEEITVTAPAGTVIKIHTCEMVMPDGTPDYFTNRNALATDTYICAGTGEERYRPRFTYHGFRYATVSGLKDVSSFSIRQNQISADLEGGSGFSCSEPMVNRVHELCAHSMRCNFVSIPTDTPVRDERTPCQMDSQMVEASAIHNFNMESYYRKWLNDITCTPFSAGEGNPDWHGDYIMLSYRMWRFYGDEGPARTFYPRIMEDLEKWMEKSGGIIKTGFGDWCPPNPGGWENYFGSVTAANTSLFYADICVAEELSKLVGNMENAEKCRLWKQQVRDAFEKECIAGDGTILNGKQTELLMPIYYGLLQGEALEKALPMLKKKLTEDGRLDTGAYATATLPAAAFACGAEDALMTILRRGAYPGYGYQMAKGSTSLWEQWRYKGPMNSHGHSMHGGIDAAFYRVFCGITATAPAYRSFRVAPRLPREMSFAECALRTASGTIKVSVRRMYGGLEIDLTVPPNTSAALTFPDFASYENCGLWDGERRIEKKETLALGSGVYRFRLVPENIIGENAENL